MSGTIMDRIAYGDTTAVEECLSKFGGLVWSLARRLSASAEDAEDAVQEVFVDVWRNAGKFDPAIASESTFVTMIARRRLIDRHRRLARRAPTAELVEQADGTAGSPRDEIELSEEAERISRLMQQLKPDEQKVLKLAIHEGLSQSMIAEQLGMPLGTVKTHARRGLMRLREMAGSEEQDSVRGAAE